MARDPYQFLTFREKVEPIVQLCHTILEKSGEPYQENDRTRGAFYSGGYRFKAPIKEGSEEDYALKILRAVDFALAATGLDEARKRAWDAGQLIFDAHIVFKGKKTALHAAYRAGLAHRVRARERDEEVASWQQEIEARPAWKPRAVALRAIADRVGLKVNSVRMRLRRTAKRRRSTRPRKK